MKTRHTNEQWNLDYLYWEDSKYLTVVDHYSGFLWLYALKNMRAEELLSKFDDHVKK